MIEIIEARYTVDEESDFWACWLELSQGAESYLLPTTAPGDLLEADLQAYFDALEARLFAVAQVKNIATDEIYERLERRIIKALALVIMDEINILRAREGLAERTAEQLRQAIKGKL